MGGGVPSDYFVSTQLQLWLFCCWGCGCCWAVTTTKVMVVLLLALWFLLGCDNNYSYGCFVVGVVVVVGLRQYLY